MEAAESLFECLEHVADPMWRIRGEPGEFGIPFRPYCV